MYLIGKTKYDWVYTKYIMTEFSITTVGYALEDKIAKKVAEKATHVYLPASWEGKKVRVILLEELDE